ncbi:hypothetical protein [Methylovirgula sp. 4M-Z18]|uniref:hypothetical protein n=1 Tax=Methylovirgula sp. 4M-Z18 TaxID=2293567 RepID=UPI000E2FF057|nr:hypothetical protein [Methylovirgula sp. 4M-Z18]RFB78524.1 hypothetical protein DYH55_14980 [Methylovirgula sp. 4M-Z18]
MRNVCFAFLFLGIAPAAQAFDLTVVNTSKDALTHLFLSPAGANQWGDDQLDADDDDVTMQPGENFIFKGLSGGAYDVKFSKDEESDTGCILHNVQVNADTKAEITSELLASCPK